MDEDECGDVIVLPLYASLPPDQQVPPPQLQDAIAVLYLALFAQSIASYLSSVLVIFKLPH